MTRSELQTMLAQAAALDTFTGMSVWAGFGRAVASIPDCVDKLLPSDPWKPWSTVGPYIQEAGYYESLPFYCLAYHPDDGVFEAVYRAPASVPDGNPDDVLSWFVDGEELTDRLPTHWMEMPEPPEEPNDAV